jgi:RIO-like serine/threonine protein kinase
MTSCWNEKNSTTRKDNRVYYINLESGISQWGIPANNMLLPAGWEIHFSKSKKRMFYSNLKKKIIQWDKPTKEDGNEVPEGWKEMKSSKCNSIYYKNTKTGEVQWIIPDDLSIKPVGIGIPKSFRDIVENCTQNDIWTWKETDHIGTGGSGSAYITCKDMDCEYVVKVQQENEKFYTEIEALLSLKDTKVVPKIFAAWTCKKIGYFVMEKLYPCTHNDYFMWKEVGKKLDIIKDQGYLHFDISRLNVMCKKNGEVVLIDFGLAIKRTEQGDNEGYKTDHAALLTWEELSILQEHSLYDHFNFNSDSLDYTSRTEYETAKEKVLKNYDVVREKILAAGVIWYREQEEERIRKQKESVKPDDIPTIFVESTKPITKLSKKDVKPVGIGIPKSFRDIVEDCTQNKMWKKDKLLGSGKAGSVYIACKTADDCEYVIKIQNQNKEYYTEIEALLSLQHTKAVPKVFAAWTCDKFGYFVMEKLYPCIHHNNNSMWMAVGIKLDIIRKEGYLQVDIHNGNVMCNKQGQVVLIDFGYAVKRTDKGDKQEYPDHIVSENYGIPLTWEYLEIVQENNYNTHLNPLMTQDQKDINANIEKKYTDAKTKVVEKIRKQKDKNKDIEKKYTDAKTKVEEKIPKQKEVLHPDDEGQNRLSPTISMEYFMIVTTRNNHNERLKKLYIKNYSHNKDFSPEHMYETVMSSQDMWFHLVNNNDMIIGCCSVEIEENKYIFDDVFIEEEFRGNNYAKLLLLYAMKSVRANNIDASFQITAHDYNTPAVKTYSRIFGEPIRVENNMFVYSGVTEHELEMQLANVPLVSLV